MIGGRASAPGGAAAAGWRAAAWAPAAATAARLGRRASRAQRCRERLHQLLVAWGVERREHPRARLAPHLLEPRAQRFEGVALLELLGVRPQRLELHVEVADVAEHARDPAQIVAQRDEVGRQCVGEEPQRGAHPPAGDAHVVQRLDFLAEPRARLVREVGAQLAAQGRVGDRHETRAAVVLERAEVGRIGRAQRGRGEAGLELRAAGGRQSGAFQQLPRERLDRLEAALAADLELQAPQLDRRAAAVPYPIQLDRGAVEGDLGQHGVALAEVEAAALGAQHEQRPQLAHAGHGAHALRDRAGAGQQRQAVRSREALVDLTAPARAAAGGGARLQRRLRRAAAVAHAQHEAGAMERPIAGLEVEVEQLALIARLQPQVGGGRGAAHAALGLGEVVDGELPLDFLVVEVRGRAGRGRRSLHTRECRGCEARQSPSIGGIRVGFRG